MADDDVEIRLGLTGEQETSRGLKRVAGDERRVGTEAARAGVQARAMGVAYSTATRNMGAGLADVRRGAQWTAAGIVGLGIAGTKWGLGFNAQVEGARERFRLFTNDVDGLMRSVQGIDAASQFNFGDLADAAALLGNQGVQNVPNVLQGIANAAAASGRGTQALNSIAIAIGQIQAKGRLSQEEINQITEAGGPGAMQAVQQAFGLTAKQLQNLGGQGLEANKAIDAITKNWTSGRMANAAERQLHTLGGQWALFTGNMQKAAGAATLGLAHGLERDVLPAANKAVGEITKIFGAEGLSNEQKLRRAREVIRRELGPIAQDLIQGIEDADVAGKLLDAFESAMSKLSTAAANEAPHVVGAFVNAWLDAGPWAKLISGAWLARKLGLDKGALALLAGGKGGGVKGGLGGIASKSQPVPVWVVNSPGGSKVPGGNRIKDIAKTVGPVVATRALPIAGGVAGAAAFGGIAALALTHNENFPTKGPGASSPSNPEGHVPFVPGPMQRVTTPDVNVSVQIDRREIARAQARANTEKLARGG